MTKNVINKITYVWICSTSLFLFNQELYAMSGDINSPNIVEPHHVLLWRHGVRTANVEDMERSLKIGYLPHQLEIDHAFKIFVFHEKRNNIILLFQKYEISPSQKAFDSVFATAAQNNNRDVMQWLLTLQSSDMHRPSQNGVNNAFIYAAENNHQNIMEWLLTQPSGIPLPDEHGITYAFAGRTPLNIRRWILTHASFIALPNLDLIIAMYRDNCASNNPESNEYRELLESFVPLEERINQGRAPGHVLQGAPIQMIRDQGMAYEVHYYTAARVPRANSSGRNSPSESQNLFDAVLSTIETRIQRVNPVEIDLIRPRLMSAIEHIYAGNPEKIALATQALENGYAYENAPLYLQKVLTFLDHLPTPELKFNLWFKGFIDESITAYQNSRHQLSCTQGIEERILTGLRGVDEELDQIFKHAEAPFLMKKFVENNFNMGSHERIQKVSHLLKTLGVLPSTSVNDAKKVLSDYINRELGVHQIPIPLNVQEYVSYAIQAFEDIYDEKIKPFL